MHQGFIRATLLGLSLSLFTLPSSAGDNKPGIYNSAEGFVTAAFGEQPPSAKTVWLAGELKQQVSDILGHNYPSLRLRYWQNGDQSAWVLEEIGKEKPITVGFLVSNQGIESVEVLAFRESRGWEVKYPFFTDQFRGVRITDDAKLDQSIDGITGATLSVRALTKLARMALLLHQHVLDKDAA